MTSLSATMYLWCYAKVFKHNLSQNEEPFQGEDL